MDNINDLQEAGGAVVAIKYDHSCPYDLLKGLEPVGSSVDEDLCRWNWDAYQFDGITLVVGDHDLWGNVEAAELANQFEARAEMLMYLDGTPRYEDSYERLAELREEFADKVKDLYYSATLPFQKALIRSLMSEL